MIVTEANNQASLSRKKNIETILNARAVSRGIAVGKVVCLHGHKRQFYRIDLKNSEIEKELIRFRLAVQFAESQLENINALKSEFAGENKTSIFDAHLLILKDKLLLSKIENALKTQKINAEWAVKTVTDGIIAGFKTIGDAYFQDRFADIEDVTERIQNALGGAETASIKLEKNSIIAAVEIKPSTLIELNASRPQAIITEKGGWTSHAFILARELNLPVVTGLKGIMRRIQTGDELIVDGFTGQVILNPKKETAQKFKLAAEEFREINAEITEQTKSPLKTLDEREVIIRANVDLPAGYLKAKQYGAKGIGLYRSESLFNLYKGFPTEDEQIEAYKRTAKLVGKDGVCIRTFDLNIEQVTETSAEKEQNPALGLRGIRSGLLQKEQLHIQLGAILQASVADEIDIILPMISDVSEILLTKAILDEEKQKLRNRKMRFGNPRIGIMIEVPATIFIVEEIAETVDFLCLGTNDLVQYLLAVDRDNESVADCFRTLHPAVLRSIKKVIDAAEACRIPLMICGEMAGSPIYAAILVGLGAVELSMNPNSIQRVRQTISAIAFEEAREIAGQLLKCKTADAVERLVTELFLKKWSHLFSPDNLPPMKDK